MPSTNYMHLIMRSIVSISEVFFICTVRRLRTRLLQCYFYSDMQIMNMHLNSYRNDTKAISILNDYT